MTVASADLRIEEAIVKIERVDEIDGVGAHCGERLVELVARHRDLLGANIAVFEQIGATIEQLIVQIDVEDGR